MRRLPRPLLLTLLLAACPGEVDPPPGDGTVTPEVLAAGGDCAAATGAGPSTISGSSTPIAARRC